MLFWFPDSNHLSLCLKGKFYLVIEELSQLFRSLVPIQLWYKYIMGDDPSSSYFLGGILIILYSLCKVSTTSVNICSKIRARSTAEGNKYTFKLLPSLLRKESCSCWGHPVLQLSKYFALPLCGHWWARERCVIAHAVLHQADEVIAVF